ncbi:MAG: AraC family transcriptional regulator [Chloroflexota bacterium]
MENQNAMMAEYLTLLERHATDEGLCPTDISNFFTLRRTEATHREPIVCPPGIVVGGQGQKDTYLEGKRYELSRGNYLAVFVPMAVECETFEASPEEPLLGAGIGIDMNRITQVILKMENFDTATNRQGALTVQDGSHTSAIFSAPIKEHLLDTVVRLLRALDDPGEAAILGDAFIDEVYFRVLKEEHGGALKLLLQQRGQIHQISRAVEHIHENLDKQVSVDELANISHMSSSRFHKKFKEVMHLPPVQYAKSIKLNRAQTYLMDGKSVSEASELVGYNNLGQFSREYKRHFGIAPSATVV